MSEQELIDYLTMMIQMNLVGDEPDIYLQLIAKLTELKLLKQQMSAEPERLC